jgi:hypothetical protein
MAASRLMPTALPPNFANPALGVLLTEPLTFAAPNDGPDTASSSTTPRSRRAGGNRGDDSLSKASGKGTS